MSEFVTLCSRDRLPIVWLQDTSGIDVGNPAEEAELLGLGQSLIYSIENSHVPQILLEKVQQQLTMYWVDHKVIIQMLSH